MPAIIAALLLATVLASCSAGEPVATGGAAPGTTAAPSAGSVPTGSKVIAECTAIVLEKLTASESAAATLEDVTCGAPGTGTALGTVVQEGSADQLAFMVADGAGWRVQERRPAAAALAADFTPPENFSLSLYRTWRDKYELRLRPGPSTTRSASRAPGTTALTSDAWCQRQGTGYICKDPRPSTTTTTAPKPTTTKAPTTTTPTTAPPVTTAPPPKQPSNFCLANPFDPRCKDPSFPG